jgi:o-succinylbenzoate synthase
MALHASFTKKVFRFNFEARTSRGVMKDKTSWFIKIWDDGNPGIMGIGECGPLPGLSPDAVPGFESILKEVLAHVPRSLSLTDSPLQTLPNFVPPNFPSITFGMETALLDLMHGGKRIIFDNDFIRGKGIPINGLVWMGDLAFMMSQIDQKIEQGFQCIKLKVGSLDFDRECEILAYIRERYRDQNISIRLDANGAFKVGEALSKLKMLATFKVHSIEQPVPPNCLEMAELCRQSPIPVSLDEELIGTENQDEKFKMLSRIMPQFITLKPTLHGGVSGCAAWIEVAERLGIGWWITSALESNIGLNAICQFTGNYDNTIHQGLGTGAIYQNNFDSPLYVQDGQIFITPSWPWDVQID